MGASHSVDAPMHIEDALAQFTLQLEADGRSPHTVQQYQRHARLFGSWLAPEDDLRRVDHGTIARFLASPCARARADGRPRKATSTNALRTSIRCFFGYLSASGALERDPARLVRRARTGTPPPRCLSPEDQARLLTVLRVVDGGRDHALFSLLLGAGLRIGSALALEVGDLDLDRGEAQLRRTKGDRPTVAVLPREVCGTLRAYLAGRTDGLVFPGITARHANRRLKHWLGRAGIAVPASCHSLRHSFAMRVHARTGDLLVTQAALGHASIASTTVYARADRDRVRAAVGA
jgi:site-specific recombinase XerD